MRKSLEDLGHMIVPGKKHPDLPEEYRKWEVYLKDAGYCIMCIPKSFKEKAIENADEMWMYEAPISTRYFLHNLDKMEKIDDYLFLEVEYDPIFGIITDSEFYEY